MKKYQLNKYHLKIYFFAIILFCLSSVSFSESGVKEIEWKKLLEFNYDTGMMSPDMMMLKNKTIKIAGFIVPLEMDGYIGDVKEFLLVPDPMSCIHAPPPPPNQMIYIVMDKAIPLDMDFRGVYITGTFTFMSSEDSEWLSDMVNTDIIGFMMRGTEASEANIELKDPWLDILGGDPSDTY